MGRKRFYDAVRDLIRDVQDEPVTRRPRLSIASLLAAPMKCAACWELIPEAVHVPFSCNACLGAYCKPCLQEYCRAALTDRSILPLRCADCDCRAPVPLSSVTPLLSPEEGNRLARFQQEIMRPRAGKDVPSDTDAEDRRNTGLSRMEEQDASVLGLMSQMGWQQCPDCGMGIERTQGCPHMVCVCGSEFCYSCGSRWQAGGYGCPRRCGLLGDDGTDQILPDAFDAMRDEVWQRIVDLLAQLREHLQAQDRLRHERRVPAISLARIRRSHREEVSAASSNGKMSLGSLVHQDHW